VAAQILHDDQIVLAASHQLLSFDNLLAVEAFATSLAGDALPFDRTIETILDPLPEQGLLVIKASRILVESADPCDPDYAKRMPIAGNQRWF
jgi:hypothetical protein